MAKHTIDELRQWQALPLSIKIRMTEERIRMWVREFGEDGVYVSFSGGKDSTVLLDIVRNRCGYTDVPAVFVDTGLEYPEIRSFVRTFDNVVWLKPKMQFRKVIEKYGYPFISKSVSQDIYEIRRAMFTKGIAKEESGTWKRKFSPDSDYVKQNSTFVQTRWDYLISAPFTVSHMCCAVMKKNPAKEYEKLNDRKVITAEMAEESRLRTSNWLVHGCNMYDKKRPKSAPLSFWTEQDILRYIKENNLPISSVYGDVVADEAKANVPVGQMQINEDGSITECECKLRTTGRKRTGCMFCGYGCHLEKQGEGRFESMKETHPKQYEWIMKDWNKGGLGYKKVIDWINENGNLNIKY